MDPDFPSKEQFEQYLRGDLSPEAAAQFQAYIEAHPGRRGMAAGMLAAMHGVQGGVVPDYAEARRRFLQRLADETATAGSPMADASHDQSFRRPSRSWSPSSQFAGQGPRGVRRVQRALAGMVIAASLIFGAVLFTSKRPSPPSIERSYRTDAGQRVTVTLRDGSRVILGPQSRLDVLSGFGAASRRVQLHGEGYFTVAPLSDAPFLVHTGAVTTRVLGTVFDIRHYATDGTVDVAVVSGKVLSAGTRASATLTAGMVAHVTDSTAITDAAANVSSYAAWTNDQLVFERIPVSAMLTTVGRWYGYTFQLTDSTLATQRVSATFRIDESAKTLAAIEHLLDATMTFTGATVVVHPRHTPAQAEHAPVRDPKSPPTEVGK